MQSIKLVEHCLSGTTKFHVLTPKPMKDSQISNSRKKLARFIKVDTNRIKLIEKKQIKNINFPKKRVTGKQTFKALFKAW